MSLWRDELRASRATLAALVALALVAVGSLSRLIESPDYLVWAIPALAIGAAFALFFGHRSLGIGFGLLVLGGFLTLPGLFVRAESGLAPTPEAFVAVRRLIAAGLKAAPKETPPVEAEPQFLVLVWVALLLLGFLGASWIVVRRPVGAVISALGIVTFTGAIGDGPGRNVYALAAVAATIGFFLAEGRHRIGRWAGGRLRIPVWFGIPTLALATAFALASPFVFGDQPIVQLRSALRPRVVIIKPLSDIQRQLKVDPPIEVMRVVAAQPTYWRLTGLDTFDGREWSLEARPRPIRDGLIPQPNPPVTGEMLEQRVRLTSLLSPWVPAAYAARSLDSGGADIDLDEGSQTLLLRGETSPGLGYTVRSQLPRVQVNTTGPVRDVADDRERIFGDLGRPIAGDARTPLDIARKLEDHFRGFTYSEDVPAGHTVERLQQFLTARTGYCEQFAATMTLMLRGLGVDARVGVGFLPGADRGGEFVVSTRDAHAWVEANIPGAGWTTFDPTPGRGAASSAPELEDETTTPEPVPQQTAVPEPTPATEDLPEEVTPAPVSTRVLQTAMWSAVALAVVGAVPTAKIVRRRRRRRGAPDAVVLGAYAELVDRARDLGWRQADSETHREFARRLATAEEPATRVIAVLTTRALYGPGATDEADAAAAWTSLVAAREALTKRASRFRLVVAVFDPRTFIPPDLFARVRGRVAVAFGRA